MLGMGLSSTAGWAQTASGGLEEVIVTARKTDESLQTTPVAVTALTEADLTQQQVVQVSDLQRTTPSLSIGGAGTGPSSIVYMAIRGEAQNSPNSASDAAVGIYVDGVYLGRPIVGNLGVLDVQRAEVLRGPQGTLFGRNTTGGALSIVTNQPTGEFEGYLKAGYGNYSDQLGEAVINLPIMGDELATRVAFRYTKHDGYYPNPVNGVDQAALDHDYAGRAQVRWAPSSVPLTLVVSADYDEMRDTGTPTALAGFNPDGQAFFPLIPLLTGLNPTDYLVSNGNNYSHSFGDPRTPDAQINTPFNRNKVKGVTANLDFDLGAAHVKSISAYRESSTGNSLDLDATPIRFISFISEYFQNQFSQELQVSGKIADNFDVIGGVYYFRESGSEHSDSHTFGVLYDAGLSPVEPGIDRNLADFEARSHAVFAQTNYHFTPTVRATVGYRYTWDDRDLIRHGRRDILGANTCQVGNRQEPCDDLKSASFGYPAWTAGVDWQASDELFLYAKTSRASMAGGFNTRPVPATVSDSFQPETNQDVEIGAKADLFDRHLRTNLALFHAWQDNVQRIVNTVVGTPPQPTQYVANSGKSRTYGAELEITALPWTGMEINASAAYLHAKYKKGSFRETQLVGGVAVEVDRSDEPIPQAPQYTFNLGATQTLDVPFGSLQFHADYAWIDDRVYTWATPAAQLSDAVKAQWDIANSLGVIESYGLLNARIGLILDDPNIEFTVWGRNLTDEEYFTQLYDGYIGLGTAEKYQGNPRTYGMTVAYHF
jgi:iron complex outermembrane receptor protein